MATPTDPDVHRVGKVERKFREFADGLGIEPGPLLQQLVREGVTQRELATKLGCTRQAVGIMSARYGCPFPGARLDLDESSQLLGYEGFQGYLLQNKDTPQPVMARELGVSLSTLRRRIYKLRKSENNGNKK